MERRNRAHHTVLRALADRAEAAKEKCVCTQYADALCDEFIFEVKSIEDHDEVAQVRAAVVNSTTTCLFIATCPDSDMPVVCGFRPPNFGKSSGVSVRSGAHRGHHFCGRTLPLRRANNGTIALALPLNAA